MIWLLALIILAHSPDVANHDWYESLHLPNGGSCCSQSDGRTTDVKIVDGPYQAWIDARFPGGEGVGWVDVKPEAILENTDNPTGEPVVFWRNIRGVICLVRPTES